MDMALRVLLRRRAPPKCLKKIPFSADRYSSPRGGFQVLWGFVHPSVEMQRLSDGSRGWDGYPEEPPEFGRNSLIFWIQYLDTYRHKDAQPIQHKILTPHPNECGRDS
jgi:hypothetical protein